MRCTISNGIVIGFVGMRLMTKRILVIFSFLAAIQAALANAKGFRCHHYLTEHRDQVEDLSSTQRLISYLNILFEQDMITSKSLQTLSDEIKKHGKIITNPVLHQMTPHGVSFTESSYEIHYENLRHYLKSGNLNYEEILLWSLQVLKDSEKVRQRKDEAHVKTQKMFIEMQLHPVKKGSFLMGPDKVRTELTYDIAVMSTPVSQWMWVEEMGQNPSANTDEEQSIVIQVNGHPIQLNPDSHVRRVTWYSAAVFANRLSEKHGLKKVYDFSDVQFVEGTSVEAGTLEAKTVGENNKVKINGSNIYETEGFRLPTQAEQSYLLTNRGRVEEADVVESFRNVEEPPATLIDGYTFYGLGWLYEFSNDKYPLDAEESFDRSYYGGLLNTFPQRSVRRDFISPNLRPAIDHGFRLVRTLR